MDIFSKRNNTDSLLFKFMELIGNPISFEKIETELHLHPDYPSMLSLSDILTNFKINNRAFRIGFEDINQVPLPFIAYTTKIDNEYLLVKALNEKNITVSNGSGKQTNMAIEEFKSIFDDVVLIAQTNLSENKLNLQERLKRAELRGSILIGLTVIFLIATILSQSNLLTVFSWQTLLLALFKSCGLMVSILLLIQSIDSNNTLVQKICGGEKDENCNAVLSSKAANVFEGLSWSEVGFFYFAGTLLALTFGNLSITGMQILSLLNLASLPYTFYSIYYQAKVAKQWCKLCCIVQLLLWLEFIPLSRYINYSFTSMDLGEWTRLLAFLLLPVISWLFLKPVLLQLQKAKPLRNQLRAFKYNTDIFNTLLKKQSYFRVPDKDWCITLGNSEANTIITLVSNPYCAPCSKAHEILDEWLDTNKNLQLRIVFNALNTDKDYKTEVVRHLMALNNSEGEEGVRKALDDWYAQKYKNYKAWAVKYPVSLDETAFHKLDEQKKWCIAAEITGTPTIYINGFKLPEIYQIEDLKYMLIP